MPVISIMTFAQEWSICKIVSSVFIIIHIKGSAGWIQLSSVRDSTPLGGDSSLDPSFSGLVSPSWYRKGFSLFLLVPASRTASSAAPHGGALYPAMSHLERQGWPQLPLEVVSSVPQLAPRVSGELTSSQSFLPCQEADCTFLTTLSASTGSPNYRTNV